MAICRRNSPHRYPNRSGPRWRPLIGRTRRISGDSSPLAAGSRSGGVGQHPGSGGSVGGGLQQRFGGRPIAVILEQSRGALVYMLTKYPHLVLFPVHPTTAARYREAFAPSGAKSDPSDTDFLLSSLPLRPRRPHKSSDPALLYSRYVPQSDRRDNGDAAKDWTDGVPKIRCLLHGLSGITNQQPRDRWTSGVF